MSLHSPRRTHHFTPVVCQLGIAGVALGASLLLGGCRCEGDRSPAPPPEAASASKSETEPALDEDLLTALQKATEECVPATQPGRLTCSGPAHSAIVRSFNVGERNRVAALPTFVHALTRDDERLTAATASVLYAAYRKGLGASTGDVPERSVDSELARRLLDVALSLSPGLASQVTPAATHAMALSEQVAPLLERMNDEVPVQVRAMAYRHLMTYGRADVLDELKEIAAGPSRALTLAAIEAPRHMQDWSADEQKQVCPWVASLVDDPRTPIASNAIAALGNCTGSELATLLDHIEQAISGGKYSYVEAAALRDACGDGSRPGESPTDEQCAKVRELLTKAATSTALEGRVRAMSLYALAHDRDDATTRQLARRLQRDPAPEVQQAAGRLLERSAGRTPAP